MHPKALAYLDDIIVLGKTFEDHTENLSQVFRKLKEVKLKPNPNKCKFFQKSFKCLDHLVGEMALKPIRELKIFLDMASWYRKFVPGFSQIVFSLTKIIEEDSQMEWSNKLLK